MVEPLYFQCKECKVLSLVGELISHMLHGQERKKTNKQKKWDKRCSTSKDKEEALFIMTYFFLSLNIGYLKKKKKVTDETVHNSIKSSHAQDVPNTLLVIAQFCLFIGVEGSFVV